MQRLANGILNVLIVEGLADREFIRDMTVNLELATSSAAAYWPSRAERTTGVPLLIVERANSFAPRAHCQTPDSTKPPPPNAQSLRWQP